MLTFHLLDAIVQDAYQKESEDSILFEPLGDDDVGSGGSSEAGTTTTMLIHLFGSTHEGRPVHLQVSGFQPFFYVRLPDGLKTTQKQFRDKVIRQIEYFERREQGQKKRGEFTRAGLLRGGLDMTFVERKVLYGYTADRRFPFMKLTVLSMTGFRALKKLFLDSDTSQPKFEITRGGGALDVYEANLDPMLRFFHLQDIKPCGWVEVEVDDEESADTSDDEGSGLQTVQAVVEWDSVKPCLSPPGAAAPFKMAVWDIECYSESGEFPVPEKGYERLAKQLVALGGTAEEAATRIVNAAVYPDTAKNGLDPLRRRAFKRGEERTFNGYDRDERDRPLPGPGFRERLEYMLSEEWVREGLEKAVAGREDKVERVAALQALLEKALRGVLPLAGDPVIQIGVVLVQAGRPTDKHIFVLDTCDPVEGATVHAYKTETELILGWAKAMQRWNPDMLIGYNTFGFDERYLWKRAEELGLTEKESIQALSRMTDQGKKAALEEKFLSSSALGDNTMWIWSTHGRLQIDLYHYIKRSFSLPAYKLDYVCQHFMSGKLSGVDTSAQPGCWILKTKSTGDVVIGRFVTLLDETGDTVAEKLKIIGVDAGKAVIVEAPTGDDAGDLTAAASDAVKWAIVKDDVSPQDIFRLQRGTAADRAKVAAYCVQDCDLVVELYKKLDVFNNAMAMANACSVPVSYIFTRGQGIKIESLIFKECHQREQCILVQTTQPRRKEGEEEDGAAAGTAAAEEESYEGAIVLTPRPGFYFKSPIGVADFASLYPSTIISENISHDTLLWAKDFAIDEKGSPVGFLGYSYGSPEEEAAATGLPVAWTEIAFDIWGNKEGDMRKHPEKVKKGLRVCRYAQGKIGTLPDIVAKLLAARKAKRKEAEKESDPFKKALLDAEQLAYKLTANSLYGQLGSATFKVRLQHLAASVTAYGRKQIMFAKAAIERFYGPAAGRPDCCAETVYGDTDSLFICFNVRDPATGKLLEGREAIVATQELTTEAGKFVTTCLKRPHDFEYDKVFSPFIIFSKKRYVGNKYEESPDEYYQNSMGIATKRRDYAGIVKVIYGGAIRILLTDRDPMAAATFVREKLAELAEGRASMTQLTMSKSLRSEYKSATPPAHKILAERITARDPGNAPASGDRISFLYILPPRGQEFSKLQGNRIETPAWIRENGLQVDAKFYMEHQLMNPISQLFALCVEDLPGCKAPGGVPWDSVIMADREYAAGEYLFRDALNMCDRQSTIDKYFGAAKTPGSSKKESGKKESAARTAEAAAEPKVKKQTTLSSFLTETYAYKDIKKEVQKVVKAAVATATTTATATTAATSETTPEPRRSGRVASSARKNGK